MHLFKASKSYCFMVASPSGDRLMAPQVIAKSAVRPNNRRPEVLLFKGLINNYEDYDERHEGSDCGDMRGRRALRL